MPQRIACKYGSCTSKQNSTNRQVNGAPGVHFIKFPSSKKESEKCKRWVRACGRKDFTISNVSRGTYICSRHFFDLSGPTETYPDPIPLATLLDPNFSFQALENKQNQSTRAREIQENNNQINIPGDNGFQKRLDFKELTPPSGWSMQFLESGVSFTKHRNRHIVLSCEFFLNESISETISVSINALSKNIPFTKIVQNLKIENNSDIFNFLERLNHFKICPGNDDKDLVSLYKTRRPNNHKTNSNYCDNLKSVYSNRCECLIESKKVRCVACKKYRSSLRTLRLRSKAVANLKAEVKTKSQKAKKKIKTKCVLSLNGKKEMSKLKLLFTQKIKKEKPGSFMSIFIKQQIKALERSKHGMRWDSFFLKWCSNIKNKSKSSYEALRKSGIIVLPSTRTLYNHDHTTRNKSGFNEDAFREMVDITNIDNLPEYKKYFVLLLDEMSIKPDLICHKDTGCMTGFIDINDHHNMLDDIEPTVNEINTPPLATSILQFMLRGIASNIRIPFAHFPTNGATSAELYSVIWEAIALLENNGFRILAVVGDGAASNRKFFHMCSSEENEKNVPFVTQNIYAADEERDIYFISDPPHLIKTVRNCFSNSGAHSKAQALWKNGEEIAWKVIERIYYSQLRMKGQFKNVSKLTYAHVFLNTYLKMRVNLAVQVMSETVASAIEFLFPENKYRETIKFIRTFDKFFDLCNVQNYSESSRKRKPNKKVYENVNDERLKWLEGDFIKYLDDWEKSVANRPGEYTKSERSKMLLNTSTIEGLKMTALSTVNIVKFLLNKGAKYVLTQHLNKDPLEQYFGRQRCAFGRNCNPSATLFEANMDKLKALSGLVVEAVNGNDTISDKKIN